MVPHLGWICLLMSIILLNYNRKNPLSIIFLFHFFPYHSHHSRYPFLVTQLPFSDPLWFCPFRTYIYDVTQFWPLSVGIGVTTESEYTIYLHPVTATYYFLTIVYTYNRLGLWILSCYPNTNWDLHLQHIFLCQLLQLELVAFALSNGWVYQDLRRLWNMSTRHLYLSPIIPLRSPRSWSPSIQRWKDY